MKGWIVNYTTLKNGKYKGWGMYMEGRPEADTAREPADTLPDQEAVG